MARFKETGSITHGAGQVATHQPAVGLHPPHAYSLWGAIVRRFRDPGTDRSLGESPLTWRCDRSPEVRDRDPPAFDRGAGSPGRGTQRSSYHVHAFRTRSS